MSTLPATEIAGQFEPDLAAAACPPAVTSPAPRAAWHELAAADQQALVTQTPAWTDCLCAVAGARDASRLYDFGGGRRLVLPLVRRHRSPWLAQSHPDAWGIGGLVGGAPRPAEVRAVLDDLRALPGLGARVRPNPLQGAAWAAGAPGGVTVLGRRAHAIDLREGFEHVWKTGFSSRARNHVRRAERAGLTIDVDDEGRLVPAFHALFMQSVERWAGKQNEPPALARWRARRRDSLDKLWHMVADMGGAARLWMAFSGGRPAAGILVLQGRNAHYTRGAMDAALAGPSRANYLLHRLAIEDACRRGSATYQMGETGTSRSLAQFKESLGAQPHDYAEYRVERLPITAADRALRRTAKSLLRFRDDG
jgi:hypothetical protein